MSDKKIQILPLVKKDSETPAREHYSLSQLLFDLEVLRGEVLIKEAVAAERQAISSRLDEIKAYFLSLEKTNQSVTVNRKTAEKTESPVNFPGFIGNNRLIRGLVEESARWALTPYPVLITGETGTGKEMFARLIHRISGRKKFLPVNCGAIPGSLIEAELFGHTKGAFTGAQQNRAGKFEEADGGTIFLDEIGELEEYIQVKLLRVIQFGEIQRLGSDKVIKVKTRIIAATNQKIQEQIASGRLREDLYYRLSCFELKIPPLRERRDEIAGLLKHFMLNCSVEIGKPLPCLSGILQKFLYEEYPFPGNIRELENIARRIVVSTDDKAIKDKLLSDYCAHGDKNATPAKLAEKLNGMTGKAISATLASYHGSVPKSATALGISQSRLYQLCRKYGLKPAEFIKGS